MRTINVAVMRETANEFIRTIVTDTAIKPTTLLRYKRATPETVLVKTFSSFELYGGLR